LSALKTQAPAIAIAIENETAQRQDAWVSLIQKKLNWGGFNQQTKAIAAQVKSEIDSAIQAAQAQQDAERRAQEQVAQQRADQQQFAQRQQVMDGGTCQLVAQSVPPQGGGTCALCGVLNVLSTTIARNNAYRSCMQAHGWTVQ